jgi:nucleotide-binding universal stress UspA family protein
VPLAKAYQADITALNVIQVPAQLPPSEGRKYISRSRDLLVKAVECAEKEGIPVYSLVKLTHNVPKAIIETCAERKIDLTILGWEGEKSAYDRVFGTKLDEIILNTVCDLALICRAPLPDEEIARVLIPVSSIRYAILSLKMAEALRRDQNTPIVLFHATYQEDIEAVERRFRSDLLKMKDEVNPERYQVLVRKTTSVLGAILTEIQHRDLVIMGAPEEGLVRRALFGDVPVRIAQETEVPLILTKKYTGHVKSWFQKFFGSRKTMLD